MSAEHPEAGVAQTPAPVPKVAVPPQRAGKPAKAPLADPPRSEATETEDTVPEARSNPAPPTAPSRAQADQVGLASWYGGKFHRRRTASGELFDMRALTAAHPTLPFGSFVCVRSTVNGRTVIVRINDRGPHTGKRVIDLSRAAAEELGMIGLGLKPVELFALQDGERDCPEP
ncbi:septal ring lytic transglycosylase RlpA family protein [Acidovorax sp.]|uniref:septal ring lytic transglycosylase RlpA family protein n=1 Tax=Acidovorax sp. TaxID=1872122 RepID=UPI00391CED32